jgi:hypothetical protein
MAEDKRSNPYPHPTAADAELAPGTREDKAARNIVSRLVTGIPKRAYITGDSDHAPVVKGVKEFTTAVYEMLDAIDGNSDDADLCHKRIEVVREMMEDHRCPISPES